MKIKKLLSLLLIVLLAFPLVGCDKKEKGSVFLDSKGEVIGWVSSKYGSVEPEKEQYADYLILAMQEAVDIICERQTVDRKTANLYLYDYSYVISTKLDLNVQNRLTNSLESGNYENMFDYAVAVTDLKGGIVAAFSSNKDTDNLNSGIFGKNYPCSSIKPLSVYAPLVDSGAINWTSVQKDTPVKQVEKDNKTVNWPSNANGKYSEENVTVVDAVANSYNTIAVKWLKELTVEKSCDFLDKLGVNLTYEKQAATSFGDDEVLGNLALGYIKSGVSVTDMAGYYQMFANGGKYSEPRAVTSIEREGKGFYTEVKTEHSVIKESTAFIVNNLLQEVVRNGTGKSALVNGYEVAGKTGTSDENGDNWFVGVTPQYSCAVWHGANKETQKNKNIAAKMFSEIFSDISHKQTNFPKCDSIKRIAYCPVSGKKYTKNCKGVKMGYYCGTDNLNPCDIH